MRKKRKFAILAPPLPALVALCMPSTAFAIPIPVAFVFAQVTTSSETPSWGLFEFMTLLGSLAMFLYGMMRMSEGLQQAAGKKLRHMMGSMTSNRFKGTLVGLGITSLLQSSSITTVMAVSFVNVGILTLTQAAGVVLGANIGTTLTAWIVDAFGFKVSIAPYALVMLAFGFPMLFLRSPQVQGWGKAIIGFAFLFMGLSYLTTALPTLGPDSSFVHFFLQLSDIPVLGLVVSVLLGTLLTVIIQSSSATVALTMALTVSGMIPFTVAAAMILGENIGTTITAELAATVGNVNAKRTARFHMLFNGFGVIWALLSFPWLIRLVAFITEYISGGSPLIDSGTYSSTGLAVFHTTFNVLNVLIFIGFVPQLIRIVERTVPEPKDEKEQFHLEFINSIHEIGPDLQLLEVKKELAKFGRVTSRMSGFTRDLMLEKSPKLKRDLLERIAKYEEITDRVEVEIANFLNRVSSQNASHELAIRFHGMNRIASNLERIGDLFYQISKLLEKRDEEAIEFSPLQQQRIVEMFALVDDAFRVMQENQGKNFDDVTIDKAEKIEEQLNAKRDEIRREYYENAPGIHSSTLQGDILYNNIYQTLERIGDHIINVSEGVLGKV